MRGLGLLLTVAGAAGALYFFLFFETSVQVPLGDSGGYALGGGRVVNLSLMSDRQNGIIISVAVMVVGALMVAFGPKEDPGANERKRACPFCAEMIKPEAKVCRFCGRDLPEVSSATVLIGPGDWQCRCTKVNEATQSHCPCGRARGAII